MPLGTALGSHDVILHPGKRSLVKSKEHCVLGSCLIS